jgi:mannose-6-phosphate isomerase-like protein (cupin superfamily)
MLSLALLAAAVAASTPEAAVAQNQDVPDWLHFDIDDVRAQRAEHGRPWQEFIRVPDLFTGLYEIPAGGEDRQSPHDADEVYYVIAGRATAVVEGDRIDVGPGSVLFVAKEKEHRFVDITEDLSILVFFATAGEGG